MNLFLIADPSKETDALAAELSKAVPGIHIDRYTNTQDAKAGLAAPGMCDVIVLGESVPAPDAVELVSAIRSQKKPIGVIAMMGAKEKEFPADLLKSGVDNFVVKRPGYIASMIETVQQLKGKHRSEPTPQRRQVHLLYAGNFDAAQRQLSAVPQLKLERAAIAPDGSLTAADSTIGLIDAIIIEAAVTGTNTLKMIKSAAQKMPDIPVILLIEPGGEEAAVQLMRAGAADCVTRAGSYLHRLLLVLQREIARRELIRERTALRSREERLRHIVEGMPAGVTVISPDGNFLAVNDAGLRILGAARLDQIVGKNISEFLPAEQRDQVMNFVATVCGGTAATTRINWTGFESAGLLLEFRAVPMRRDASGSMAALAVLDSGASSQQGHEPGKQKLEEALAEYEARLREIQEKQAQQEARWEAAIKEAESGRLAAEQEVLRLKTAVEEAANINRSLAEEQRLERENWEQARQGFQEQCLKIEGVAESLRSAQANLLEKHKAEQAEWEVQRRELEKKQQAAEQRLAELTQAIEQERAQLLSQHGASQSELEQKLSASEQLRLAREAELSEARARIADLTETQGAELSRRSQMCSELEQKLSNAEQHVSALENSLRESETRLSALAEKQAAEASQRELDYRALEEKFKSAEAALQESQDKLEQATGHYNAEIFRRDTAYQELEQKCKFYELQALALQTAAQDSESSLAQVSEKHAAELAQRDQAYRELEDNFKRLQDETLSLKSTLSEAESRVEQISASFNSEISRRDADLQELQQECSRLEQKAAAVLATAQEKEAGLAQTAEQATAELARRNAAYAELEEKCKSLETQSLSLQTALCEAESKLEQISGSFDAEVLRRDTALQELQQKCKLLEGQAAAMQAAIQEKEAGMAQALATHKAELARRDAEQLELKQQCESFQTQAHTLQAALQEAESKLEQISSSQQDEISRRDASLNDLAQKCSALEAQIENYQKSLRISETALAQATEAHNAELSRREAEYGELEQKCKSFEMQAAALHSALADSRSSLTKVTEMQEAELARRDAAYQELEQKLQAILQTDQSTVAQLTETHNAELARRDLALKDLEQKYQAAEKQKSALQTSIHDLEAALAQLAEKHSTELSQRDFSQKKSEQKYQAAEKQRIILEDSLQDAKASLAKITETYNSERAKWDLERQQLEQKRLEAEKQQAIALQNAVRETETRLAWISEQNQAKAVQIEKMQQEMEQLKAEYSKLTAASTDFHLRNQRISRLTSVGVVLAKLDGQVLECNDAAARIFGYAGAEEALSQSGEDQFRIYALEGALAARLEQDGRVENIEWTTLGRDGRLIRVQENASLVEGTTGEGPLVERILTDISKLHSLSEEVRRARRLESTGDLAAATVKSLKELCSSLANAGEQILKATDDSTSVQRLAETLLSDANRGVKHARQFLSVALKADRTPSLLNINDILISNDSLLHSLVGEDIDLQTSLAPKIGLVSADKNEMVQLIGNLLASSREILPLGGTVTIETSNVEVDSLTSGYPAALKPGIYVQLSFSADGCAVQPERRMGSNRTLVERMGGYLEITNDPKIGNIHRVYLPRVETCRAQKALAATAQA